MSVLRSLTLAALVATATASHAQIAFPAASPPATIQQQVGLTDIEIVYSRPAVRGREIFGHLVPWGEVWRTGANNATKVSFSTNVSLNGTPLEPGTYELHTIPGPAEWTVIIYPDSNQWGSYAYDSSRDVARFSATPVTLEDSVESLTLSLDDLTNDSATLNIAWATTRVPIAVKVDLVGQLVPQIEAAMAADSDNKPYFAAAMFYYENDLDLDLAADWMASAVAAQPGQVWMVYRQGLILAKKGDQAGARAAAESALALAKQAPGSLGEEYQRLSEALLASLD